MKINPWFIAFGLVLLPSSGRAQDTNSAPDVSTSAGNPWTFSASLYGYLVPDSRDYINPNIAADHGWLHLEARYNYETLETGSFWVGYNFSLGEKLVLELTPMLGGVFGNLTGVAPGYNLSITWKRLALYSQTEYVFDTGDSSGNFFYTWSELTYSPWDWLRAGLVVQRTKAYQSSLDIQRGFLVGFAYKKTELTTSVFNLGWTDPTIVVSIAFTF
jgi:hypothetical protein